MKNKLHLVAAFLLAVVCTVPPATSGATRKSPGPAVSPSVTPSPKPNSLRKTNPSPSPSPSPHPTATRAIGFHGKISAVDQKRKTFTVGSRVFKVTAKTTMTKAGAPATMKDVVANEEVRGSYWKLPDATLEAKLVKLGPKTEVTKKPDSSPTPSASP